MALIGKERSTYVQKQSIEGNERIIVNGTQFITPEQIAADSVHITPQTLTFAQKMQARANQGLYYDRDLVRIEWDGVVEGHETVTIPGFGQLVLVSPNPITQEDLIGSTVVQNIGYAEVIPAEVVIPLSEDAFGLYVIFGGIELLPIDVVTVDNASVTLPGIGTLTIPHKGVYFLDLSILMQGLYISSLYKTEPVKIEGRFLPLDYAKVDGTYPDMSVGRAGNLIGKNLISGTFVNRTSANDESIKTGIATIESIKGNTIVWNQVFELYAYTIYGITISAADSNGFFTITGTGDRHDGYTIGVGGVKGHKNIVILDVAKANVGIRLWLKSDYSQDVILGDKIGVTKIFVDNNNDTYTIFVPESQVREYDCKCRISCYDLTQMFGEGNEPSSVEEFEALFPEAYYPYNEGELISLNATGIKTNGFNQFDGTKAMVFGGKAYFINGTYSTLKFAKTIDGTQTDITPSDHLYTPTEDGYIFATGMSADFCINLSWSGERDGEYEPYWEETRDLPLTIITGKLNGEGESVVIFPDGMKSAGTAHDEIVGNKAIKRIGVVDLGSLDWEYTEHLLFRHSPFIDIKSDAIPGILCSQYITSARWQADGGIDKSIYSDNNRIWIKDSSYVDAASFKAAVSGVLCFYELDTPEEYILDTAIDYTYRVDDHGTERIVPQEPAPVVPITLSVRYGINAVDTLRNLSRTYASALIRQNFTENQKKLARQNIGLDSPVEFDAYKATIEALAASVGKTVVWNGDTATFE